MLVYFQTVMLRQRGLLDLITDDKKRVDISIEFHTLGNNMIIMGIPFFRKYQVTFDPRNERYLIKK